MTETAHTIRVDGTGIYVTVHSAAGRPPGSGRALVCLHGGPGIDGSGQRLMLSALADVADVVVPDQRGHGLSDPSTPDKWELDTWADDVAAIIDELGLDRPVVYGISFGGWVAIRHAARHPRQTGGLIVASMTPRVPSPEEIARRMGTLAGPAAEQAWLRAHYRPSTEAVEEMQRLCLPLMARRQPSPALAAVRAAQWFSPQLDAHFTPQYEILDLTPDLRGVAVPTLVILGELDPFVTAEAIAATAEALPAKGRLVTLPDVAHDLFADAPDTLLREVRDFVVDVVGAADGVDVVDSADEAGRP
ncbi:alpha/beta hydrolase [Catenulispora sp. NF23]|uniref:Alpha/beta hydrolase n=1 Tax=Catenulispora pinistramenti TaxID=2705254 RepID=A0ABS5KQC1_9ACTN|nr:alpha/beta hydrolase [Catenulispora pinistramenti]MBS2533207.1 alpha/beta hydrolase [Catenulispora pinistramenti]MBS2548200.1 alpha/beta hydrolase [Catenulispora pinistramenti]